jgi:hypothetical protein
VLPRVAVQLIVAGLVEAGKTEGSKGRRAPVALIGTVPDARVTVPPFTAVVTLTANVPEPPLNACVPEIFKLVTVVSMII